MTERDAERLPVVLDAPELGPRRQVGTLVRWPGPGTRRPVSFAYEPAWLADPGAFAIDPRTRLFAGDQPQGADTLPPILLDTTPDAWGQLLLSRAHRRLLGNWESLVEVSDETRMGALRLAVTPDGPFLRAHEPAVPPLTSLRELQELARLIESDPDAEIAEPRLRDLVLPGSSLGGARPKANVRGPDGTLWIAKFPSRDDRRLDIGAWEFVYGNLAERAGIAIAPRRLVAVAGQGRGRTHLARRFDRAADGSRRLYVSAMTLTDRRDGEPASYPDIVGAIEREGAAASIGEDLAQLFRRLLFNVVAGNRDDHLRNHGFLRTRDGWRLAPAFDLNPARAAHPHALSLDGRTDSQELVTAFATHRFYRLTEAAARAVLASVTAAVASWEIEARAAGIAKAECALVAPALMRLEEAEALLA